MASVTLVQDGNTSGTATNFAISNNATGNVLPANCTIGNTVVVFIPYNSSTNSDNISWSSSIGTFTKVDDYFNGTSYSHAWVFVCLSATGAGTDFTFDSPDAGAWNAFGSEWAGAASYSTGGGTGDASNVSVSIAPNYIGSALLVGVCLQNAQTFSANPGSPWTDYTVGAFATPNFRAVSFQANVSSTAAQTATWTNGLYNYAYATLVLNPYTAPSAPTLTSPANASYHDVSSGETFSATYNSTDGKTQNAYAMRIKTSGAGSYSYYNASTNALQSTVVWNTDSVASGGSFSATLPGSIISDGNIYNWSMASQESGANVQGSFASDFTFTAQVPPSVTITSPSGTVVGTTAPAINWTDTLPSGASQTNYRVVIESGTFSTTPGSGTSVWDSGVVSSSATTVQDGTVLTPGVSYRAFVQITESGGQTSSWAYSSFTLQANVPAAPIITGVGGNDTTTGAPTVTLTLQGQDNQLTLNQSSLESDNTTGWTPGTNATIAASSTWAQDGSYSLALTATAAGGFQAYTPIGTSGVPVVAGQTYRAMAFFHSPTTSRSCYVSVAFYNAAGSQISQPSSPIVNSTFSGNGAQALLIVTAPALATTMALVLYGNGLDAPLAAPSTPTVTAEGTTGTTTYDYEVTAINSYGATTPSGAGATTTGNATLSSTNYNLVSWPAVPLAAGSSGNLVYDSNLTNAIASVGPTWMVSGATIGTANGDWNVANPGTNSAEWVYYGTGSAAPEQFVHSQAFNVTPGSTYTLSAFMDGTNLLTGDYMQIAVWEGSTIAISVAGSSFSQAAGAKGAQSVSFVIPSGVNQVIVAPSLSWTQTGGATSGSTISWSQIQLTETSTVQTYAPGPLWTYDVYGRVSGSPSLIGSTTALAFEDTGQALGAAPPTTNTTNEVVYADCAFAGPGPQAPTAVSGYYAMVKSLNPSAWWKLNEPLGSGTVSDSSGNGYNGAVNGGVTFGQNSPITGEVTSTGALFDGSTGSTSATVPTPTGNFSMSVWVNHNGVAWSSGSEVPMTTLGPTYINVSNGQLVCSISTSGGNVVAQGGAVSTSGWHLVTMTWDGSTMRVYLDGVAVGSVATSGTLAPWSTTYVGAYSSAGSSFHGDVAEANLFPTALTASQVLALYNARTIVSTPYDTAVAQLMPSAWWKLADAVGSTTAVDSSVHGNTGTVNGGVTFGETGPITGTPTDTSVLFNGTNGYVQIPYEATLDLRGAVSLVAWIKTTDATNQQIIVGNYFATGYRLSMASGGALSLWVNNVNLLSSSASLDDGNWHMVTASVNGSGVATLYKDGVEILSATVGLPTATSAGVELCASIGNSSSPGFQMAQTAILATALTASQVSALYNASPLAGTATPIQPDKWTVGGFVGATYANFNFSDDNVNFFAVRNGTNLAIPPTTQTVTVVDYEGSLGFNRHYTAQVSY